MFLSGGWGDKTFFWNVSLVLLASADPSQIQVCARECGLCHGYCAGTRCREVFCKVRAPAAFGFRKMLASPVIVIGRQTACIKPHASPARCAPTRPARERAGRCQEWEGDSHRWGGLAPESSEKMKRKSVRLIPANRKQESPPPVQRTPLLALAATKGRSQRIAERRWWWICALVLNERVCNRIMRWGGQAECPLLFGSAEVVMLSLTSGLFCSKLFDCDTPFFSTFLLRTVAAFSVAGVWYLQYILCQSNCTTQLAFENTLIFTFWTKWECASVQTNFSSLGSRYINNNSG